MSAVLHDHAVWCTSVHMSPCVSRLIGGCAGSAYYADIWQLKLDAHITAANMSTSDIHNATAGVMTSFTVTARAPGTSAMGKQPNGEVIPWGKYMHMLCAHHAYDVLLMLAVHASHRAMVFMFPHCIMHVIRVTMWHVID